MAKIEIKALSRFTTQAKAMCYNELKFAIGDYNGGKSYYSGYSPRDFMYTLSSVIVPNIIGVYQNHVNKTIRNATVFWVVQSELGGENPKISVCFSSNSEKKIADVVITLGEQ